MKFLKFFSSAFLIITSFFVAGKVYSQVEFIENKGQWDEKVKFMSHAGDGAFFLEKDGFTVLVHNPQDLQRMADGHHGVITNNEKGVPPVLHSHAYKVEFVNGNPSPEIIADKALPTVNNYFIGNDKTKWASNCKLFKGVTYKNVYPNIDVRYYSDAAGRLKYDLIVKPGADPIQIALRYKGADKLEVKNKELVIKTSVGEIKELYPYSYQVSNNERKDIEARYEVKGDVVRFNIKDYSPNSTLIIDPTEIFFTYSGSVADNWGFTATYGPDGSFFSGGIAFGNGYPVSQGAFQTSFKGGQRDIAIIKLTPDGVNRVYATYIGGTGNEQPHSMFVDPQGELVIAGRTNSSDYPTTVPVYGPGGGWDIVVTKLNASGSALIGSMRIGGTSDDGVNINVNETSGTTSLKRNYGDDARSEVIIDGGGNIYVASCTQSLGSTTTRFKTSPGVFQPNPGGGGQDAVVLKLNPSCDNVLFSTYAGGSADDAAYVLALGNNGSVYVAGGTSSTNMLGISTSGVISSTYASGNSNPCDGFVLELSNDGSTAIRGTYLGTPSADQVYGIQTDKFGYIYVMGTTEGAWPVLNAAYSNPGSKQFISKMQPDLSAYVYSTVFGSGSSLPNISPTAFLVDRCENVYVSGWGGKSNTETGYGTGTTHGMPVTPDAIKPNTDQSGSDFYFFVMKKDAVSQLYGTFFGQDDPNANSTPVTFGDHVDGGTSRFDQSGVIYQAICANCFKSVTFNGTPGSWSPNNPAAPGTSECNLGMLKIQMDFAGVHAGPQAAINAVPDDTSGCTPLLVHFTDTLLKGKRYIWDFGDGSPKVNSVGPDTSHTYISPGTYLVTLVAIDSTTCNIADTAYLHIRAGNNKAILDFIANKIPPCTNLSYNFTNTSTATVNTFGTSSFVWDFGDGSPRQTRGFSSVSHTYASPGTYKVTLVIQDTTFCNSPDSIFKTVRLSPNLKAQFVTPDKGCVPYNAVFQNTSAGGLSFLWNFGDGTTSTLDNPTHLYSNVGTYVVTLYAYDSTACNQIDSTQFTITVHDIPVAAFTFSPLPPQENTFTDFTNQSTGATSYFWNFGDGDTSIEVNPRHLFNATGTFNVCLIAISDAGCSDTVCAPVSAIIKPLLDVPNAFTPGKFGVNSIVQVQGFGIDQMHWTIYNRWGQKVFETTSRKSGWDGTYKGKLQPMDVYTYTLDVTFSDGKKVRKTGDITLLR